MYFTTLYEHEDVACDPAGNEGTNALDMTSLQAGKCVLDNAKAHCKLNMLSGSVMPTGQPH